MPLALTIGGNTEFYDDNDKDTVMLRYWQARQAGDHGAHIEKVATAPGQVSSLARARYDQQQAWLDGAGFSVAPPIYAPGTRVLPLGDKNFRLERRSVQAMPLFPDAAASVIGPA